MRISSQNAFVFFATLLACCATSFANAELSFSTEQITHGPKHHFFGYIGQCRTIPWNGSGRYILALEIDSIERMPTANDTAQILLLDTQDNYRPVPLTETRAWNPQQGAMMYWNPESPETQFFFNDRDPNTGKIFTALYDISDGVPGKRAKEFRFDDRPIANSGVAQNGGWFMAINYGRLARLRPVTGYPETFDWTDNNGQPEDDGIFRVDVKSGERRLVVSYAALADRIRPARPDVDSIPLFINHTLWSRDDSLVYAFVRGGWHKAPKGQERINVPITMKPDGSDLAVHTQFIGGHPEWLDGSQLIGKNGERQVVYDARAKAIRGYIGGETTFVDPEGDIALSPDGSWFANGFHQNGANNYTLYRMNDGLCATTEPLTVGGRTSGDLRIDPAPTWNRTNDAFIAPGLAQDGTRQMFLVRLRVKN
jgi:hypothetical protein